MCILCGYKWTNPSDFVKKKVYQISKVREEGQLIVHGYYRATLCDQRVVQGKYKIMIWRLNWDEQKFSFDFINPI